MNATLALTSNGQTVTGTITAESGAVIDTFTVKDNTKNLIRRIDAKLSDLMWNRSGFEVGMTATLTRPVTYTALMKVNAA